MSHLLPCALLAYYVELPASFQVTITPSDQDPLQVMEGGNAAIRCSVPAGTPLSSITWVRASGTVLTEVTQFPDGLLLALSSAGSEDTDLYTCTVVDVNGNNRSGSIGITVLSKRSQFVVQK